MGNLVKLAMLLCLWNACNAKKCYDPAYRHIPNHIMCHEPICVAAGELLESGLDEFEKMVMMHGINTIRSAVARGLIPAVPKAKYMKQLEWNDDMQTFAQRKANLCEKSIPSPPSFHTSRPVEMSAVFYGSFEWRDRGTPNRTNNLEALRNIMTESRPGRFHPQLLANRNNSRLSVFLYMVTARSEYVGVGRTKYVGLDRVDKKTLGDFVLTGIVSGPYNQPGEGSYFQVGEPACDVPSLNYKGLCTTEERNRNFKPLPCENDTFFQRFSIFCDDEKLFNIIHPGYPFPLKTCHALPYKIGYWLIIIFITLLAISCLIMYQVIYEPIKIFLV